MARQVAYTYKGVTKRINFAYDKYHDAHEAAAAEEGIDLKRHLMMEQQIAMTSKGNTAVRDFRDKEFARMGFGRIYLVRDDDEI
ncbi:DUF2960 family protein [Shewanella sp. NIFS-20-20]|uniref:DUF2960 family protein n=1 Tax=Shewanella sp. NIFS-20-20 TaxID=2853806 RepID=UPI001C489453|nr:DUF2960 family protein [Shewanella sp. NIFS-20-20]MBV7314486.1 DUF2960 domain-containing protein [Shewanella sp. NIFS-20-20]